MSSSTFNSSPTATARQYLVAAVAFLFIIVAASYAASFHQPRLPEGKQALEQRKALEDYNPDVFFLGNSMLSASLYPEVFSKATGKRIMTNAAGGSASSYWYLYTKNVITAAKDPPPVLVIFFRDEFLTYPDYRVDGDFRSRLMSFSIGREWELQSRALEPNRPPTEKLAERYWPLYRLRPLAHAKLINELRPRVVASMTNTTISGINPAFERTFDRRLSDQTLVTQMQLAQETVKKADRYDFKSTCPKSFLPLIFDLTEEKGIELIFVRVRRRSVLTTPQSPELLKYIADLRSYIEGRGAVLLDFMEEQSLQETHFGDGDHLNTRGREVMTKLLIERLGPLVKDAKHHKRTEEAPPGAS